ncbi:alpha/beta hydrolase family protein [Alteromonas sp. BMJM2]|uniref:alpha/beta hydrolase family protein n=1 Tax=Alteromonas sp. BMJM2 TaxID=2954241 RepID=UPI0022B5D081|nr:alpha/beta hydrolase [Alteromonas sp. BMJM2]
MNWAATDWHEKAWPVMFRLPNKLLLLVVTMLTLAGCSSLTAVDEKHSEIKTPETLATFDQVPYSSLLLLPKTVPTRIISYGSDALQTVSVYEAQKDSGGVSSSNSAIIFVHGGCWLNAYDASHGAGFYSALANTGIDTYAVEYRRTGDEGGGWPGSFHDIQDAINTITHSLSQTNEEKNVFIVGHSAGGHLALLAAASQLNIPKSINIKAVIGLAAITNVTEYAKGTNSCQTATPDFMGGKPEVRVEAYKQATPHLERIGYPVVLMQGDSDAIVPASHSESEHAKTISIVNGGHFDWLHPKSDSYKALVKVVTAND